MTNYQSDVQYLRLGGVALKNSMVMKTSNGYSHLAFAATQFLMIVNLTLNERKMAFQIVENLLRSFLRGRAWNELGIDAYSQQDSCFQIRFAPSHSVKLSGKNRREIREVVVQMDYACFELDSETQFPQMVQLSDYAMSCIAATLGKLAPAVFDDQKCKRLIQVLPLLRPLRVSLDTVDSQDTVEKLIERQILFEQNHYQPLKVQGNNKRGGSGPELGKKRSRKGNLENERVGSAFFNRCWLNNGDFCGKVPFTHRKFVVLTDDGDDLHEPLYLR